VPRPLLLSAALASVSALVLAGCGTSGETASAEKLSAVPVAAKAAIKPAANCKDGQPPVASLAPGSVTTNPNSMSNSETYKRIKATGRLTVGTSGDVLLWGARNPNTGKLEGYDIEVLKEVARRLGISDQNISYKVINYGQRLTMLNSKSVDLVAHTMTINCDRWQGTGKAPNAINFSSEYYAAGQKVLVRSDSKAKKIEDLKGQKVCVPAASTNVTQVQDMGLDLVELDVIGDCLVKFQEGEVVAITGDDTVLAGFADQDDYAKVVGDAFSEEPYGLGINADDPEFTRFVNAVLEELRTDGTLQRIYNTWMADAVTGAAPAIPRATYGRVISKLDRP
jgi:polar amino acid transport system substrate-binding protein